MRHYNPSIITRALRIFNSKQGDFLTDEVAGPIATISIHPFTNVCESKEIVNTTSGTIYTTPSDKSFYLTSASLSSIRDASATAVLFRITYYQNGVEKTLLAHSGITLTAASKDTTLSMINPILVDKNTVIAVKSNLSTGNFRCDATIQGYTEEVSVN